MKENIIFTLVLLMFFSLIFGGIFLLTKEEITSFRVTGKVLCVNENILNGDMIGMVLGLSSGNIANDVNKVGIKYALTENQVFLDDFEINHATLAYYKDCKTLDFQCKLYRSIVGGSYIIFYLNSNYIKQIYLSKELSKETREFYR